MKNKKTITTIIIILVVIIALGVLYKSTHAPVTPNTSENPNPIQETQDGYIGLTVEEAQSYAEEKQEIFRVVERDGEALPVTMDFRPGRINASVVDGIVTDFTVEGE